MEANLAYIKFQKIEVNDGDDTRVLLVINFYAVISDAVDILKQSIEWMQASGQSSNKLLQGRVPSTTSKEYNGQSFHYGKGGIVS